MQVDACGFQGRCEFLHCACFETLCSCAGAYKLSGITVLALYLRDDIWNYSRLTGWLSLVQRILFSVLKGTGHDLELLGAVAGPMENLLERRSRHHLNATQASDVEKLSPAEVDVLCILLQVLYCSITFAHSIEAPILLSYSVNDIMN